MPSDITVEIAAVTKVEKTEKPLEKPQAEKEKSLPVEPVAPPEAQSESVPDAESAELKKPAPAKPAEIVLPKRKAAEENLAQQGFHFD